MSIKTKRTVGLFLLLVMLVSVISSAAFAVEYYPQYTGDSCSIVDGLYAVGASDAEVTRAYRKEIAIANGITDYARTADQNTDLLKLLKAGKLVKPDTAPSSSTSSAPASAPATKEGCFPAYTGKVNGLNMALKAVGIDTSPDYRAQIALANGIVTDIDSYVGSYPQNAAMVELLVKGDLKKPA